MGNQYRMANICKKKGIDMKATDLMIGDWVCLKDDTKSELPLKVDGVLIDDISLEGDGFLGGVDGLIRPIPLTPEILEKNGWKDRENLMELRVNEDTYFLWSKGYGVFTGAFINQIGCYICDFKYVHTLQHLLRHYGLSYGLNELNELADNFKV